MKKFLFALLFVALITSFSPAAEQEDVSYAFGMFIAQDLMDTGLDFDYDAFSRGFRDFMESGETRFSIDEAIEILRSTFQRLDAENRERMQAEGERNLVLGSAFLAENSQKPGVTVTSSGLQFELLREGSGAYPNIADTVRVHYQGMLLDGTVFDSTYDYGEEAEFPLNDVILGWSEGLRMMRVGSRARLYLPPELAYGENGAGNIISPNAVLIFDVELLAIVP